MPASSSIATPPTAPPVADAMKMLQRATELARGGDVATARRLLAEVCFLEPANEAAWLWRASLATSMKEGAAYLEEVLRLNPANPTALAWMKKIQPTAAPPPPPAAPPAEDPWKPKASWTGGESRVAAAPAAVPAAATPAPAAAAGPALRRVAEPAPCPYCGHQPQEASLAACSGCHAILRLEPAATFALNRQLDRVAMREAVKALEAKRTGADSDLEFALAVGYLNLLDYHRAALHLQHAHTLDSQDPRLEGDQLLRYLVKPVVMAVDDSATVREYIVRILGQNDFLPVPVANSWETVDLILAHQPSMILLDVTMPMMDGHKVCRAIRGRKEIRNLPVVMLSGHDDLLDKVVGRMAGATEYLTKPFKPEQLLKTVRKYAKDRSIG